MHVRIAKSELATLLGWKDVPTRHGAVLYTAGMAVVRASNDTVTHEERVTHMLVPSSAGWLHVMVDDLSEDELKQITSESDILKVDEIAG